MSDNPPTSRKSTTGLKMDAAGRVFLARDRLVA